MEKQSYIYIITNPANTTLYTGVTSNLIKRIYEHKNKIIEGFSSKYNLTKLVYFEVFDNIEVAIEREKQIKNYKRYKKITLISETNPEWIDLYTKLI
jgi:putative endonuclease